MKKLLIILLRFVFITKKIGKLYTNASTGLVIYDKDDKAYNRKITFREIVKGY